MSNQFGTSLRLSTQQFNQHVAAAAGLKVSHVWQGFGSAIFLELGSLRKPNGAHNPRGEFSLMMEWSWRVETTGRIEFGSRSGHRKIARGLESLRGHLVLGLSVAGRLPELVVALDDDRWVHAFMTAEGQPRWVAFLPGGGWICVKRGVLYLEMGQEKDLGTGDKLDED